MENEKTVVLIQERLSQSEPKLDTLQLRIKEGKPVVYWAVSWGGIFGHADGVSGDTVIPEEVLQDLTAENLIDWMQKYDKNLFVETENVSYLAKDERVKQWCEVIREWLRKRKEKYFAYGSFSLFYEDGWFILEDGLGRCSVISEQKARDVEVEPFLNQARQDVDRGGAPWESAYERWGIEIVHENGVTRYRIPSYETDKVIAGDTPIKIKGRLEIPSKVGDHIINMVWDEAFMECADLEEVVLPETVTFIGDKAFAKCSSLRQVNIPKAVTSVGIDPFQETKLEAERDLSEPVFIMGHVLIKADPSLQGEYVVPEPVTVIGNYAFEHCHSLTRLVIPDQVSYIGNGAFYDCRSLEQIVLPKEVKEFSPYFSNCDSLEEVVLPEGVTIIGTAAFYGCEKLRKLTVPITVENIDSWAFERCPLLETEYLGSNKNVLDRLPNKIPARQLSFDPASGTRSFELDKDRKRKNLIRILAIASLILIIPGLILIWIDGKIRITEPVEYVKYSARMDSGSYIEMTLVSCEQVVRTELMPIDDDIDLHNYYTYALCVDQEGDELILAVSDLSYEGKADHSEQRDRLMEIMSGLPYSLKGKVIEADTAAQILSEGQQEDAEFGFAKIKDAHTFIEPYLEDAPVQVDHVRHTAELGHYFLRTGILLVFWLLAVCIRNAKKKY